MAKRSKGPRRPKVRVTIAAAPRVIPTVNSAFPPAPGRGARAVAPAAGAVHSRHVVHHVHHLGPSFAGMRPTAPPAMVRPIALPPLAAPVMPRPVVLGAGGGVLPPGGVTGPFQVPQPAIGAPRAPLPGPIGGIGPRRPFRGF